MADAKTIHVDIVSAEGEIFSGDAEMVFVPARRKAISASRRAMRRCSR